MPWQLIVQLALMLLRLFASRLDPSQAQIAALALARPLIVEGLALYLAQNYALEDRPVLDILKQLWANREDILEFIRQLLDMFGADVAHTA